jgi:hypothetical protein
MELSGWRLGLGFDDFMTTAPFGFLIGFRSGRSSSLLSLDLFLNLALHVAKKFGDVLKSAPLQMRNGGVVTLWSEFNGDELIHNTRIIHTNIKELPVPILGNPPKIDAFEPGNHSAGVNPMFSATH